MNFRLRRFLRSRLVIIILAAIATWATAQVIQSGVRARSAWGETRNVVQVHKRVMAGTIVSSTDVSLVSLPLTLVPEAASQSLASVIGQRPSVDLEPGDLVIEPRLHRNRSAVASRIRSGRGVAVPRDERMPPVAIGDLVEVVDPMFETQPAAQGVVIDVAEHTVTIEATPEAARTIAGAVAHNSVAVFLRP